MATKKMLAVATAVLLLLSATAVAFDTDRRDEDYNETGDDYNDGGYKFDGYMNKLEEDSDQIADDDYTYTNPDIWDNSDGSKDAADQWGISETLQWAISNRGVPYPPGPGGDNGNYDFTIYHTESGQSDATTGTYYHTDYSSNIRTSIDDNTVSKTSKAFANSFAAVAEAGYGTDEKGDTVQEDDGIWINPDDIRAMDSEIKGSWQEKVVFNIDLTGPDAGLGFHSLVADRGEIIQFNSGGKAVIADIYFEGEKDDNDNDADGATDEGWNADSVGESVEELTPPMCGDDQAEYLLEERGESVNPGEKDGRYACASRRDVCVHLGETPRIVPIGDYKEAGEPDENEGRLKNDEEVCEQRPQDPMAAWWDQDWGDINSDGVQDTCRTNSLYGDVGVRWFDSDYVRDHPFAVRGGIDDDWNTLLKHKSFQPNVSKPEQTSWSSDESPVPTGSPNKSIGTIGFCTGDDEGEYLVTQQCNGDLCDTKRKVQGAIKNPDSCVFDGDEAKYPAVSNSKSDVPVSERAIYQPGDTVTLDPQNDGNELRELTCFDNTWYRDFPVVFSRDKVEVPLGGTERVPFQVINVRDTPRTFEVRLEPGSDIYTFSKFEEQEGDTFQTTVQGESSKRFRVEINGGNVDIDASELVVEAEAVNTDMYGEDGLIVDVVNSTASNGTVTRQEPKSVPGVGPLHLLMLMAMASAAFFLQS